jgi:tRNA nucleotidyltransferase (CCA-adding enzyme)
MHRLKFDNDTLRKVSKLVLYHDDRMPATMKHVRRAMNRIGAELFPYYMKVRMADTLAQSDYQRDKKLENLAGIEKCYQEILEKKQCVSLKELKVNGQDLIAAGIEKGPKIGQTLQTLLQEVIEEPEKNTREYLLARIKELE